MDITEFRVRAMNDEVKMIDDFKVFEQKILGFKKKLYLNPYATIDEIILWCEKLIETEKKIDLISLEAKQVIQDRLKKINPDTILNHANADDKTISIWSDYVLELLDMEKRYENIVYSFCIAIDNCVRYLISYTDELYRYGFVLPQVMISAMELGTFHWINKKTKEIGIKHLTDSNTKRNK